MTFVGGKICKMENLSKLYSMLCNSIASDELFKTNGCTQFVCKFVYEKHQKCHFQTFFNAWQKESTKQLMKKKCEWKRKKQWEKYQEQNREILVGSVALLHRNGDSLYKAVILEYFLSSFSI